MHAGGLTKLADNDALTLNRAKLYDQAANTDEGKAALAKTSPQEWLWRGVGGVGGGALGWLLGKMLSKKNKTLRYLFGILGAVAGAGGADKLLHSIPGVTGSELSYSDITRLRNGLPDLVANAAKLEERGAGRPNTDSQKARNRFAETHNWSGWAAPITGLGGVLGGYGYGHVTGNFIHPIDMARAIKGMKPSTWRTGGWRKDLASVMREATHNINAADLADKTRQAASKAAYSAQAAAPGITPAVVLSDYLGNTGQSGSFTFEAGRQGLDANMLNRIRDGRGFRVVNDPGGAHLAVRNGIGRRVAAGLWNAALLGIAGYAAGAAEDVIINKTLGPAWNPGALIQGARAAF